MPDSIGNKMVADTLRDGTLLCPDFNMGRCVKGDRCTLAHKFAVPPCSDMPRVHGRGGSIEAGSTCNLVVLRPVSKARPVALRERRPSEAPPSSCTSRQA